MSTTAVFLPGAGAGPWIWERTIQHLGSASLTPDIPGRVAGATPAGCAEAVVRQIDDSGAGDVLLVLHSLAGVLAADLAERLGERLKATVLVSGVVPEAGATFARTMGFPARLILPLLFRFNREGLKPSAAMIRSELCNDLDEADAEMVIARYEAEMPGLYLTPVRSGATLPEPVYVHLTADRSVTPALQERIATRTRARVHRVDAGHLVMLSRPQELAALIRQEVSRAEASAPAG